MTDGATPLHVVVARRLRIRILDLPSGNRNGRARGGAP